MVIIWIWNLEFSFYLMTRKQLELFLIWQNASHHIWAENQVVQVLLNSKLRKQPTKLQKFLTWVSSGSTGGCCCHALLCSLTSSNTDSILCIVCECCCLISSGWYSSISLSPVSLDVLGRGREKNVIRGREWGKLQVVYIWQDPRITKN